jgi:hypothetical protein
MPRYPEPQLPKLLKAQNVIRRPWAFHDNEKDDYQRQGGTNESRDKAVHLAHNNRHEHGDEDSDGEDLA